MWRASSWRSYRVSACIVSALGAIVLFAVWIHFYAGSGREPMLEGHPVRELIRETRSADSEAAGVFRHNGSDSVPGLLRIIRSRPSFESRVADQLKKEIVGLLDIQPCSKAC